MTAPGTGTALPGACVQPQCAIVPTHASVLLTDAFTISASLWKFGGESEGPRGGVSLSIPLSRDVMLLSDVMLLRDAMLSET